MPATRRVTKGKSSPKKGKTTPKKKAAPVTVSPIKFTPRKSGKYLIGDERNEKKKSDSDEENEGSQNELEVVSTVAVTASVIERKEDAEGEGEDTEEESRGEVTTVAIPMADELPEAQPVLSSADTRLEMLMNKIGDLEKEVKSMKQAKGPTRSNSRTWMASEKLIAYLDMKDTSPPMYVFFHISSATHSLTFLMQGA